ncbi:hypothetical protein AVEN_28382-1, partial [Araneus ventricosus]
SVSNFAFNRLKERRSNRIFGFFAILRRKKRCDRLNRFPPPVLENGACC